MNDLYVRPETLHRYRSSSPLLNLFGEEQRPKPSELTFENLILQQGRQFRCQFGMLAMSNNWNPSLIILCSYYQAHIYVQSDNSVRTSSCSLYHETSKATAQQCRCKWCRLDRRYQSALSHRVSIPSNIGKERAEKTRLHSPTLQTELKTSSSRS